MLIVFWNQLEVVAMDYLLKGTTVTDAYYTIVSYVVYFYFEISVLYCHHYLCLSFVYDCIRHVFLAFCFSVYFIIPSDSDACDIKIICDIFEI